jgi:DNA helicase II / ATP-dependent DNA helicase PcrA
MSRKPFKPTSEQTDVIAHKESAFISACPGAGKTQVLVERARQELKNSTSGQGIAFLSFTNAAISELKARLQAEALLPNPPFPHYVGTFDTFIWQFFIAPLGMPGCATHPLLIPDMNERAIAPFDGAQVIPLRCFDEVTGKLIPERAKVCGFDAAAKPVLTAKYETAARQSRSRFLARGEVGFDDVRTIVKNYLSDPLISARLAAALAARFREIVVDEAQDCNPADIEIINWLRGSGIVTKVICDPHQSIYEFRGGVTEELFALRNTFAGQNRLSMTGNFRSTPNICKTIAAFRAPAEQWMIDQSLGPLSNDTTKVCVLHFPGNSIPSSVGQKFSNLLDDHGLKALQCPVVSSAKDAACKAIGQAADTSTGDRTLRLALAVTSFHAGVDVGSRKSAMESVHSIVLELGGKMGCKTYYQYVAAEELRVEDWRPEILQLLKSLRYDPAHDTSVDGWLTKARTLLSCYLGGGGSIAQKLRNHQGLGAILSCKPASNLSARTIHSVKGMEFPGICVVLSPRTCKELLDYLITGEPTDSAEAARKLYVAASRAERLLVIAVPRSQGPRLVEHIKKTGAEMIEFNL